MLFDLLDVMTDRCPTLNIDRFLTDEATRTLWNMFKKVRLELKGY